MDRQASDKEEAEIRRETRLKRQNTMSYKLWWRPELVPSSLQVLQDLGLDVQLLRQDGLICLCLDKASGRVCIGQVARASPEASVSIAYLACVLRVLRDHRREPCFSLDAKDPHDLGGDHLVKRFFPDWLSGTVVGEVLFQADYALKQLCFGDERLPGIPSAWDEAMAGDKEHRAARQWFTIRTATVTVGADGCLVPYVQMGVEARRLVPSPTGYVDAAYTDRNDPYSRQAAAVTERFAEVVAQLPVAAELMALARATVLAVHLLGRGVRRNDHALNLYAMPEVPEAKEYPLEIPTLRKNRTQHTLDDKDEAGRLCMRTYSRSMHGGVDLSVPKTVPIRQSPERFLDVRSRPLALPLFLPSAARCA